MAYTAKQYTAQDRVMERVRSSNLTGRCPVCTLRPCAVWPDGVRRITCGNEACYTEWLRIHPAAHATATPAAAPDMGVDSLDTQPPAEPEPMPDLFTVSLVTG